MPASWRQNRAPIARLPQTKAKSPRKTRAEWASIENERKKIIDEIVALRGAPGGPLPSVDTAQALLTRHWIRGDWRKREQLIAAARWLLRLEDVHRGRTLGIAEAGTQESVRW